MQNDRWKEKKRGECSKIKRKKKGIMYLRILE
jgi:hypothetical protein